MALSKQAIRSGVHVLIENELQNKEDLIKLSETWTEKQEVFFRKMLQQGGKFKMNGDSFEIKIRERILTTNGEVDGGVVKLPGDGARF